jgi:tRNA-dihydrouridine synthase A
MISTLHKHGCNKFIIHARKALLNGISPKENRTIPPLRYDVVHRIKQDFHNLEIVINGGIKTYEEVDEQLKLTDGVMIGREFGNNPYLLAELDCKIYGSEQISRKNILLSFLEYSHKINKSNISNNYNVWLHTHRLFAHQKNSSLFRKIITDHSNNLDTLEKTLKLHEFI